MKPLKQSIFLPLFALIAFLGLGAGTVLADNNNQLTIKATHFSPSEVQRAAALPITIPIVSTKLPPALEPLEDNLVRMWNFDDVTETWSFFDPRPGFADFNTLTLVDAQNYWIKVTQDQMVTLNGEARTLSAGWNYIVW